MTHTQTCPLCRAPVASADGNSIPKSLVSSGNVILVSGIQYASFEAMTRHVFSQMPVDFQNRSGACFAQYRSGACHDYDFILVVTGEGNDESLAVLTELLPLANNIFAIGKMSRAEMDLLTGCAAPRRVGHSAAVGVTDWPSYFASAMNQALREISVN